MVKNSMYLLDTNVISEGSKLSPNPKIAEKLDLFSDFCKVSTISWYELQKGIKRLPEGKKKRFLADYAVEQVAKIYDFLPYTKECGDTQAEIYAKLEKRGKAVPYQDSQIAATALANDLILVTRNVKDFEEIVHEFPLKIENWFE